jgi:hypothetical protein
MALVIAWAIQNIKGNAANHVKMKLKGSGNCINQKNVVTNNKISWMTLVATIGKLEPKIY